MAILNLIDISMIYAQINNNSNLSSLPNSIEGLEKKIDLPVDNFLLDLSKKDSFALEEDNTEELEERIDETFISPSFPITNTTILGPVLEENNKELNNTSLNKSKENLLNTEKTISKSNTSNSNIKINNHHEIKAYNLFSKRIEPSIAENGQGTVFMTGNRVAFVTFNDGKNGTFINPKTDFSVFCCDQDVIYDDTNNIFIWYRQGKQDSAIVRLSISHNAKNWTSYDIRPTDFNPRWKDLWFDYPTLALGNDYLYITTNVFLKNEFRNNNYKNPQNLTDTDFPLISRWSLKDLSNGASPTVSYITDIQPAQTFTPVQGATNIMYWASHLDNQVIRIYKWPEITEWHGITIYDKKIDPWQPLSNKNPISENNVNGDCPGPAQQRFGLSMQVDWCDNNDSRITSGWIANQTIGFLWNAGQGNNKTSIHGAFFKFPYINAATFNTTNMEYIDRPYIWNRDYAWQFGFAAPNSNDKVGIIATYGGGDLFPSLAVGMLNENNESSQWKLKTIAKGTHGPICDFTENGWVCQWGDYQRIRSSLSNPNGWIAAGYLLQGNDEHEIVHVVRFEPNVK